MGIAVRALGGRRCYRSWRCACWSFTQRTNGRRRKQRRPRGPRCGQHWPTTSLVCSAHAALIEAGRRQTLAHDRWHLDTANGDAQDKGVSPLGRRNQKNPVLDLSSGTVGHRGWQLAAMQAPTTTAFARQSSVGAPLHRTAEMKPTSRQDARDFARALAGARTPCGSAPLAPDCRSFGREANRRR